MTIDQEVGRAKPNIVLRELREEMLGTGHAMSTTQLWRVLKRMGLLENANDPGRVDHTGILAAMTLEAAIDRDVFLRYLEVLCPKAALRPMW